MKMKNLIQVGKLEKSGLQVCMKADHRRKSSHFFLYEEKSGCVAEISLLKAGYTKFYPGKVLPLTEEICTELNVWMDRTDVSPDGDVSNWYSLILVWNCLNPKLRLSITTHSVCPDYSRLYLKGRRQ